MANCFCGNVTASTSYNSYNICVDCMRQLLDCFSREHKTDAEEALWERFLPTENVGWIDVEYAVQRWINVFFFSGDESEYYIPNEYISKEICICGCKRPVDQRCGTEEYLDDVGACNTCNAPCFGYICNRCETLQIEWCKKQEEEMLEVMRNDLIDPILDVLDPDNIEVRRVQNNG